MTRIVTGNLGPRWRGIEVVTGWVVFFVILTTLAVLFLALWQFGMGIYGPLGAFGSLVCIVGSYAISGFV